jgi:hypothetical protein
MKWIRPWSILILCGWFTTSWPGVSAGQVLQQTFSENLAEFSISSPDERWHFTPRSVTPGPLRATLRFQSAVDQFVPNVTVRVTGLPNPQVKLADLVEEDIKTLSSEVEILSQGPIKHGAFDGFEIQMRDAKIQVRLVQWIFLGKGKNFVITGAAKESAWPRLEGDIKKILNSFEIR